MIEDKSLGPAAPDLVDGLLEPAPDRAREEAVRLVIEAIDSIEPLKPQD